MSHARTKKHVVIERTERHLSLARAVGGILLFSMSTLDGFFKDDFDFPPICYVLIVGVILGLDMPKIVKFFVGKKT